MGINGALIKTGFVLFCGACLFNMNRIAEAGRGEIHPLSNKPKVVRVYNKNAVTWDYKTEPYLDFIDQRIVNRMLEVGLLELTGEDNIAKAWRDIFPSYKPGDRIAIKPNFNALGHGKYKDIITTPQVISAVIKGLVDSLRVPEEDIFVYDVCQIITDEVVRNRIKYPVNYVQRFKPVSMTEKIEYKLKRYLNLGLDSADISATVHMRGKVVDEDGNPVICYLPKALTQAQHLINIPLMTNHIFVLESGPLKNHFGTVRFSDQQPFPDALHGALEKSIVDLNLNPHIKNKTRLIVCDALFGVYCRGEGGVKRKWRTFPSENGIPNSLFLSKDPVALESVLSDYILTERQFHGYKIFSHAYLHDAMENGLGVHEHRDEDRHYKKINYREVSAK